MSDKPKKPNSYLPILWPMWLIFFLIVNLPIYLFVIRLSFKGWTWEIALNAASMDRFISLIALALIIVDIWLLIGMVRLVQKKWKEIDFL